MATYNINTDTIPSKLNSGDIIVCPYSGEIKSLSLNPGEYQLECWGGKGGTYSTSYGVGGNGGYTIGTYTTNTSITLYLVSGGAGLPGVSSTLVTGGYNGGGNGAYHRGSSGGGATHIATQTGLLSALESYQSSILAVAGGGGGGAYYTSYSGGNGGGVAGADSSGYSASYTAKGGTQSSGGTGGGYNGYFGSDGSFGQGGNAITDTTSYSLSGGGGGGFYGGGGGGYKGSSSYQGTSGGGGGSGYVSPQLTNAQTSQESTSTNPDTENYAGYIRITVISSRYILYKTNDQWVQCNRILTKQNDEWIG